MFVIHNLLPGQGLICRECTYFLAQLWAAGHVAPCSLVGWRGARHHKPAIARDGRSCPRFLARCDFLVDGEPVVVDSAHQIAPGSRFAEGWHDSTSSATGPQSRL